MATLEYLQARGFDESTRKPGTRLYNVRCSRCAASVVCGFAIHETGCPNDTHECNGCNAIIPARQRYCEDCAPR